MNQFNFLSVVKNDKLISTYEIKQEELINDDLKK
ncbi:MAG: hypothetical protein CM1200mP33_7110 [Chloroflexota bacterium]|nr:MAG: hypothetical protein CM1200mP33_7110 [Chloroflexota bacterium]